MKITEDSQDSTTRTTTTYRTTLTRKYDENLHDARGQSDSTCKGFYQAKWGGPDKELSMHRQELSMSHIGMADR